MRLGTSKIRKDSFQLKAFGGITFFVCTGSACLLGVGIAVATAGDLALPRDQGQKFHRQPLTFAERVAYQHVIEEVYWRHRIWPKGNPRPKPPLNAIVSQSQIEQKVEQYLRKSQRVTDRRGRPIAESDLQAEMERIAHQTRQPEVLRELFRALANDPLVIAECLVRPILAERLINSPDSHDGAEELVGTGAITPERFDLPEILPINCADNWIPTTITNVPIARWDHSAIWTGTEMIIWGGLDQESMVTDTGGRYNPALDNWSSTNLTNAPVMRWRHCAVWTGSEMIVWGGGGNNILETGGRYNPITDAWVATSAVNVPMARISHSGVWTGTEMIVWGGYGCQGNCILNTGGRYNPSNDSWTPTSIGPSARFKHSALWTGSEMIVWGGSDSMHYLHTGGRYNPSTDNWTPTGMTNVPPGRIVHSAVWTGTEMIVWGGVDETFSVTDTGGRYNPVNDSWVATSLVSAPLARAVHSGVWTGNEMIVWGGGNTGGDFNTGGKYNAATDSWTSTTTTNAPSARDSHRAVWTGSEMIVWGGFADSGLVLDTGGRYCAQSAPSPMPTSTATATSTPATSPNPTPTLTPAATPTPTASPTATPISPAILANISTRLRVETDDNVLIGGFIVAGSQPKKVIVRAIGPSLSSSFPDALADPVLELRDSSGTLIRSNDNWRSDQEAEIIATGIPPANDLESAIVAILPANNSAYTATMSGTQNGTGIGVVEIYDLDQTANSDLANISTRGLVQTGDNVLIGGLILLGQNPLRVIVRAIGPSLNIGGKLADPTLELRDANGALIRSNDNWRTDQEAEIIATGIPPTNDLESALVENLASGNYTAIVRGAGGTTGIGLVEIYALK